MFDSRARVDLQHDFDDDAECDGMDVWRRISRYNPLFCHGSGKILEEPQRNRVYTRTPGLEAAREGVSWEAFDPMKAHTAGTEQREVMDIRQAADYLGISADTLYKYASEGFVPAFKLGNRWRFKRSRLNDWMDQQSTGGNMPATRVEEKPSRPKAKKPVESVRPARRKSAAQ
jgi:excisionase family DNA binding protein